MTVKPQESSSISCRISLSSYCIHWIRQPAGKDLEWLRFFLVMVALTSKTHKKKKNSLKTRSVSPRTKPITVFLQGDNFHTENDCITVQESHTVICMTKQATALYKNLNKRIRYTYYHPSSHTHPFIKKCFKIFKKL